jgi:hypothetical protein
MKILLSLGPGSSLTLLTAMPAATTAAAIPERLVIEAEGDQVRPLRQEPNSQTATR